ncbi:MAG: hypothetical protein IJY62_03800 [Clostridia bacterium]|nr:hypothetical protein [Clostridia bacterium]
MKTSEKLVSALLTVLLGVLFIVMKGGVVSVAMTILGAVLIVLGVLNLIDKQVAPAVVKIVIGALIIVCGWLIVRVVLYIVAALLLIYGILDLYARIKAGLKCDNVWKTVIVYAKPVLMIVLGLLLFLSSLDWIFVLVGICAILEGALMLFDLLKKEE